MNYLCMCICRTSFLIFLTFDYLRLPGSTSQTTQLCLTRKPCSLIRKKIRQPCNSEDLDLFLDAIFSYPYSAMDSGAPVLLCLHNCYVETGLDSELHREQHTYCAFVWKYFCQGLLAARLPAV